MTHLQQKIRDEFDKVWGMNRAEGDVLPAQLEAFLDKIPALVIEDAKDFIEAECEWVKECTDPECHSDGYYRVQKSDLEALSTLK